MSEERSAHDLEYPDIPSIPEEQEEDVLSTPSRWETKKRHIDRQSAVMSSDRIFVLEKGQVVEVGTHSELLSLRGIYYNLWNKSVAL